MILNSVSQTLLAANNLALNDLDNTLDILFERKLTYGDIYFQSSFQEVWGIDDRIIKSASYHIQQGVGVRAIMGEKTGFAYADDISLAGLKRSAIAARGISLENNQPTARKLIPVHAPRIYGSQNPLHSFSQEQKVALLHRIDQFARSLDRRVIEVRASLVGEYEEILVAATDGTLAADIRPLTRLSVTVLVEEDGRRESGNAGGGNRQDYNYFLNQTSQAEGLAEIYVREAVRMALVNLSAVAAPAGTMPVILGAGWPAVLLHEAVGHGLEGDFNRKGTSVFSGKVGELVTSDICSIVDDGTLLDRRGSLTIDDEGTPAQRNVLIENGVLKGYLQDKLNATLMGLKPTGNGRRESYAALPLPRMTNTYMLPGKSTFDEIVGSVKHGIYAPNFSGGQVDITSGKFVFTSSEAYLIENGKITKPVKGATLIGSGIETMQQISMVGNDLAFDNGVGVCGKDGQSVPVGVGQPAVKVERLTVGGTLA